MLFILIYLYRGLLGPKLLMHKIAAANSVLMKTTTTAMAANTHEDLTGRIPLICMMVSRSSVACAGRRSKISVAVGCAFIK